MTSLYQSYKEQIKEYAKKKELESSVEEKLKFKWKIILIVAGVFLIVLVGGLSEIVKEIAKFQVYDYDTTFLYSMLTKTKTLTTTGDIKNFLVGLNASEEIKYDTAQLVVFTQDSIDMNDLIANVSNKENLIYFWDVQVDGNPLKFGFYLQKELPENENKIYVADDRNHKVSSVFSLAKEEGMRLNITDQCFLYQLVDSSLTLAELLAIRSDQIIELKVNKWECFGLTEEQGRNKATSLIGYPLATNTTVEVSLNTLEVYQLSLKNEDIVL